MEAKTELWQEAWENLETADDSAEMEDITAAPKNRRNSQDISSSKPLTDFSKQKK